MKLIQNLHKKNTKIAVLTGIMFGIALLENAYHGVELFFISIVPILYYTYINRHKIKRHSLTVTKNIVIYALISASFVLYLYASYTRPIYNHNTQSTLSASVRSESARWAFSARPWNYVIPDIDHPVFGNFAVKTYYWIWSHKPYYLTEPFFPKEHSLFLGYTLMGLTLYTLYLAYVKKEDGIASSSPMAIPRNDSELSLREAAGDEAISSAWTRGVLSEKTKQYVTYFLIIGITAFIFSMPPYIAFKGIKLYFPSHFIYRVLPQLRAYARFGVFVVISNIAIAMVGLKYISDSMMGGEGGGKSTKQSAFAQLPPSLSACRIKRTLTIGAISTLAIFEFLNFPSMHAISILPTPPYIWLSKQQGNFSYMEIPERTDYTDYLYQSIHNKKILNPYLRTPKNIKELEDIIWLRSEIDGSATRDKLFCKNFTELDGKYLFYHKKDLNKGNVIDTFTETWKVTPQLKTALAESWGQPVWGNHVPKTEKDTQREMIKRNMENILNNDPKFIKVKTFTNEDIVNSRPNSNFSADKFDEVIVYKLNTKYCDSLW